MNTATKIFTRTLVLNIVCGIAMAQQAAAPATAPAAAPAAAPAPAAKSTAQIDAGEPRANDAAPAGAAPMADQAAPAAAAPTAPGPTPAPVRAATKTAAGERVQTTAAGAAGQRSTAADRLNMNTTTVTGDREQPKVMYVVPWKSANIGDLSGKPMNSLLDEVLAPVDREEFKREVAYYDAASAPAPQNGVKPPAGPGAR